MRHDMSLRPEPFAAISSGRKRYELRLHDEKRRSIRIGDEICFHRTTDGVSVTVCVKGLHLYDSFDELYNALPLLECGYTEQTLPNASPKDMEQYYYREDQIRWGVMAIEIVLTEK